MRTSASTDDGDLRSLNRHALAAILAIGGLVVGLGGWASSVQVAGAVIANGAIGVESYPKRIQHQEGGTVRAFYVRDGDRVKQGQLLVALDDTLAAANLAVLRSRWRELAVREARLQAEIDGKSEFVVPGALAQAESEPQITELMATEQQVFRSRTIAKQGRAAQLQEQISQLKAQIEGLDLQRSAIERQVRISNEEMASFESLRSGQLIEASRITTLGKQQAELEGRLGEIISATAGAKAAIAERTLQITQLGDDLLTTTLEQLQEARRSLSETAEQMRAAEERLQRTQIRAPQNGIIHESSVHTVGGVVAPGETLMTIIPQGETMLVNAQISPSDVDRVKPGQETILRLTSLDLRATPELTGVIDTVSPDVSQDPKTGSIFYRARLVIAPDELSKLSGPDVLLPGMPVEAFIKTEERTVLSYMLKPFVDEMRRALRED
jgi:HlyD family secretion protein